MARRRRRDLEGDEDDAVTPEEIEEIELEAVLAVDQDFEVIIAWLKRKYPIGGCTAHPMQHCFFNKLGHWILDMHKLLVWAVDIKGRKTTGTRPPVLDPVFLDDMAEEPEVVGAAIRPLDTTAYNTSAALVPTVPTPTLHYNPHAPMISTTAESDNFPVFLFYTVCVWSRYPTLADNYMKVRSDLVRKVERVKYTAAEHEPELFADDRPLKA